MKKIIALLLAVLFCMTFVACGSDPKQRDSGTTEETDGGMTVADFLDTAEGKLAVEGFKENAEAGGYCTAQCYADGNTMVFDAQFTQEFPATAADQVNEMMSDYLEDETTVDSMQEVLSGLEKEGINNPQAKIIYRSVDGEILVEKTYTLD